MLKTRYHFRLLPILVFCCVAAYWVSPARSDAPSFPRARMQRTIDQGKMRGRMSVSFRRANSGKVLFDYHGDAALNPASNTKILTSFVALDTLGPAHQFQTKLAGTITGHAVQGGLYLVGGGDPSLSYTDLLQMASRLHSLGVRNVDQVFVDDTLFDDHYLPPAFEQQPNEVSAFRASISAAAVDHSAYTLTLMQNADKPKVDIVGRGYFRIENELKHSSSTVPQILLDQRAEQDKMFVRISGGLPRDVRHIQYRRRVEHPSLFAGYVLIDALHSQKIQTPQRVELARVKPETATLAVHESPPLSTLMYSVGKFSSNFAAEMLVKAVAATRQSPASSQKGIELIKKHVQHSIGIVPTIVNGSGLFNGNKVSAHTFTKLLSHIYRHAPFRSEFISHLAIGGQDGTLVKRFNDLSRRPIVRAKTGTLADVVSLSGYVLSNRSTDSAIAFSILINGVEGSVYDARVFADSLVSIVVNHGFE